MGNGTYANGKFHLTVSLQYLATQEQIDQWHNAFNFASQLLFNATEGQMQFGTILFGNNSAGLNDADMRLREQDCPDHSCRSGTVRKKDCPGSFVPGKDPVSTVESYCYLYHDETRRPYVIVHEFGHYAFCLTDEYEIVTENGTSVTKHLCTGDPKTHACIMEFGWKNGLRLKPDGTIEDQGEVSEFCCHKNHSGSKAVKLQAKSCWDLISENYKISGPAPDKLPAPSPPSSGLDGIDWKPLSSGTKTLMIVDLKKPKENLDHGVRLVRQVLGELSEVEVVTSPLSRADTKSDKESLSAIIRSFQSQPLVSRQNVVWLTDSFALDDESLMRLAAEFRSARLRFHSVAVSQSEGKTNLQQLSLRANGGSRILVVEQQNVASQRLYAQLLASALESTEHFAVVEHERCQLLMPERAANVGHLTNENVWQKSFVNAHRAELPVLVESDAEAAVFSFLDSGDEVLQHILITPDGEPFVATDLPKTSAIVDRQQGFTAVIVDSPMPGSWLMVSERVAGDAAANVELLSAVRNRQLSASLHLTPLTKRRYRVTAVAIAEHQLLHLEPAFATIERLTDDDGWELQQTVRLTSGTADSDRHSAHLTFTTDTLSPGTYRFSTRLVNSGHARGTAGDDLEQSSASGSIAAAAPLFSRLLQKTIFVSDDINSAVDPD